MFVVFGTLTAGQVDVVDKRFNVATEYFHIMWLPLIPIASRVIVDLKVARKYGLAPVDAPPEEDESVEEDQATAAATPGDVAEEPTASEELDTDTREVRFDIPMSPRSVLLGYLRGGGFWLGIFLGGLGGLLGIMSSDDPEAAGMYPGFLIAAGVALAVAIGSYYGPWNRATPARAQQLCEAIGMDPKTLPNELR